MPATDRPREHLDNLLGERADAEAVCTRLGIGDLWDPALTRERASAAIDLLVQSERRK